MADAYEGLPIVYAPDASGALRHVDDVPNGLACGCTCPDPACGQELVARNRGAKRAHHFAHRRGTCEWSVEYLITSLAAEVVEQAGSMAFPELCYQDAEKGAEVEISPARTLRVTSAGLESVSGRGAPEMVVTCRAGSGEERRFAVVLSLIHPLADGQAAKLAEAGLDTVLVDLRSSLKARKRELGKHYDRVAVVAGYQDKERIGRVLADEGHPLKTWAVNSRRDAAEAESRERLRARRATEAAESERRAREEAARRRAAAEERERREAERKREAARLAEESARAEEAAAEEASRKRSEAVAAEAVRFEARGWHALPLVARGVNRYAQGCPLHGEANVAMHCGAYSFSTNHCESFKALGNFSVGCGHDALKL